MRIALIGGMAVLACAPPVLTAAPPPGVTLVGNGFIPGDALDKSGLPGKICKLGADPSIPANCVPQAIFGGLGSAFTYTGHDGVFVATPDRGPFDGLTDTPYLDRLHFLHISLDTTRTFSNIKTVLLETRLLKSEGNRNFVGAASAFSTTDPRANLRFDPEGVRVGPLGSLYVSDEYGPYIKQFTATGHLLRNIPVPPKFAISYPSSDPLAEAAANVFGRQANRGMEGLAITPYGLYLVGAMQNALIQDHGFDTSTPAADDRLGLCNRLVKINTLTGESKEYVYVLETIKAGQGVSEILAINDHEFLVLERDNKSQLKPGDPQDPKYKQIYKIDLEGATDVSSVASLPATAAELAPLGITPVKKTLFIDLAKDYGLLKSLPEKIEGLAWGPDLPDGRRVLYVMSDNDLDPSLATQIYAFAIDTVAAGLDYQRQFQPFPLFPPGQVKKILDQQ